MAEVRRAKQWGIIENGPFDDCECPSHHVKSIELPEDVEPPPGAILEASVVYDWDGKRRSTYAVVNVPREALLASEEAPGDIDG